MVRSSRIAPGTRQLVWPATVPTSSKPSGQLLAGGGFGDGAGEGAGPGAGAGAGGNAPSPGEATRSAPPPQALSAAAVPSANRRFFAMLREAMGNSLSEWSGSGRGPAEGPGLPGLPSAGLESRRRVVGVGDDALLTRACSFHGSGRRNPAVTQER